MDKKILYTKAYTMLDKSTPMRTDCGTLCGKACCEGDEDTGMYLFPGEECMYEADASFITIKPTTFKIDENNTALLAVCKGKCERSRRPLSCRIFPLTPYITENDILIIKMDPRAGGICPIAKYSSRKHLDQNFVNNARKAFGMLIEDAAIKEFIVRLSRFLDHYSAPPIENFLSKTIDFTTL